MCSLRVPLLYYFLYDRYTLSKQCSVITLTLWREARSRFVSHFSPNNAFLSLCTVPSGKLRSRNLYSVSFAPIEFHTNTLEGNMALVPMRATAHGVSVSMVIMGMHGKHGNGLSFALSAPCGRQLLYRKTKFSGTTSPS